jgi:predicted DNA-binding transcriptional regulator AlpA
MLAEQQNVLTSRQTARYLGVSEAVLRLWRSRCEGPRYFRAGEKLIRYRRIDLDLWIESRLSDPRSEVILLHVKCREQSPAFGPFIRLTRRAYAGISAKHG